MHALSVHRLRPGPIIAINMQLVDSHVTIAKDAMETVCTPCVHGHALYVEKRACMCTRLLYRALDDI